MKDKMKKTIKIKVLIEVENRQTLRKILEIGKAYSLLDCKILNFKVLKKGDDAKLHT